MQNLASVIKEHTRVHLTEKKLGRLYAQCVKAVGWIGGTVPELQGDEIVELPTSDVSNGGIVVGAALAGERPIYVVRYQGFLAYNMITILNYAAKSLEMWDTPCPVLVRALGMEGAIGPVASNMHHSMVMRMPGIKVACPMTPNEWTQVYEAYLKDNQPYFISEDRKAFNNTEEFRDRFDLSYGIYKKGPIPDTIILVGDIRLKTQEIEERFPTANIFHVWQLKPLALRLNLIRSASLSNKIVIVDSDYVACGAGEHIAYTLQAHMNVRKRASMSSFQSPNIKVLGLQERTAGFSKEKDNLSPTIDDIERVINGCDN